jgi:hypothetical protein
MATLLAALLDVIAISIVVFGLYFPRHHRTDLIAAFLGVNIGVFAVTAMLATATVGAGLGLGLFGVLSIIRLRSSEISQSEVAYYFASLAIGLLAGLTNPITMTAIGLVALIIVALVLADSKRLFGAYMTQDVTLDKAVADPQELKARLSELLAAEVMGVNVIRLDLVNDLTIVQVRMRRNNQRKTISTDSNRARPAENMRREQPRMSSSISNMSLDTQSQQYDELYTGQSFEDQIYANQEA